MAYDEGVAQRVREALEDQPDVTEKRMFGGLAFMLRGHMCIGVLRNDLMVRVGPEQYEECLTLPHARQMDFTGQPLTGFLFVDPQGFESDKDLLAWVKRAVRFVSSLPPKR
jgi:TfoX/Sxy family transcriptional regulator of competence genes